MKRKSNTDKKQLSINFDMAKIVAKAVPFSNSKSTKECKVFSINDKVLQMKKNAELDLINYILNNTRSF